MSRDPKPAVSTPPKTAKAETGAPLYFARRGWFDYGAHVGLDRGQVIALAGEQNDEVLVRLGYLEALPATVRPFGCRYCDRQFVDLQTVNAHGRQRHRPTEESPTLRQLRELTEEIRSQGRAPTDEEQNQLDTLALSAGESADHAADSADRQNPEPYFDQTAAERGVRP